MCLIVTKEAKTTKKPVTCYKVLSQLVLGDICTPYRSITVNDRILSGEEDFCAIGEVRYCRDDSVYDGSVYEGFSVAEGVIHVYAKQEDAIQDAIWFKRANPCNIYRVYKCVIPENCLYIEGYTEVSEVDDTGFSTSDSHKFQSYAAKRIRFVEQIFRTI